MRHDITSSSTRQRDVHDRGGPDFNVSTLLSAAGILLLCFPLFIPSQISSPTLLPPDMHELILSTSDAIYNGNFKQAEQSARKLIRKFSYHPAGYFFLAVAFDAWMEYYRCSDKENQFYDYCDRAIEKAEIALQKNSDDIWAGFFLGGSYGYKGTYEARYGKWITAFRHGWQGVSLLKKLFEKAPDCVDALYGIGSYDYWRSAMTREMKWLPNVADKRESGIQMLHKVVAKGIYTRLPAATALLVIMNNEKRYQQAWQMAETLLVSYPGNILFLWGRAEALLGMNHYDKADKAFGEIIRITTTDNAYPNHFWTVRACCMLARSYAQQRKKPLFQETLRTLGTYSLDKELHKLLDAELHEVGKLRKLMDGM